MAAPPSPSDHEISVWPADPVLIRAASHRDRGAIMDLTYTADDQVFGASLRAFLAAGLPER